MLTSKLSYWHFVYNGTEIKHGKPSDVPLKESLLNTGRPFVHVLGGLTLKGLWGLLLAHNLALPTAGGGSSGQSFAGFLSTGSHSGDFDRGTLLEWVRALHVVGPNGKQFWIERSPPHDVTDDVKLRQTSYWSPELEVIRDDTVFHSTIVSCGRMGIICSVIVEVVDNYHLLSWRGHSTWATVRGRLGQPVREIVDHIKTLSPVPNMHYLAITVFLDSKTSNQCFFEARQVTNNTDMSPKYDLEHDIIDDLIFHHSDWIGILKDQSQIGSKLNGLDDSEIRALQKFVFEEKRLQDYAYQGPWWHVMFDPEGQGGLRVLSAEYAFDATTSDYLDFIDQVRQLAENPIIPGILTLRFTPKSSAYLAMQQFEETVHIEMSTPLGYRPGVRYFRDVDQLARNAGGIPHWGQMHSLDRVQVQKIHGKRLTTWKQALARVAREEWRMFSNEFTRARGLEPAHRDSLLLLS